MLHTRSISRVKFLRTSILAVLFFIFLPAVSFALTPIARPDVVPLQRIEYGTTFNFGVIAFSKARISKVDFVITGQGYAGGVKTSTEMTLNSRTGVWEYWVPISSSEFTANGPVTVSATVTGGDNGTRTVDTITLIVEATGPYNHTEAWVDASSGNDTTGTVGNSSLPYRTISAAVAAAQTANGGSSSGNIIYLEDGTYSVASISASTSGEWLTITKSSTASRTAVVINTGQILTTYLKYDSVTLQSTGSGLYVAGSSATNLWTNSIRKIGSGRHVANSNPVHHSSDAHWSTNDYTYDSDYAYRRAALVRGAEIKQIGNDVFENTAFVVNCTVDDLSNGTTGWHADAFQTFTSTSAPAPDNRIVYNYKATNIHYQGVFMRSDIGQATDNAFVNVFIEMRETADQSETGAYAFTSLAVSQSWDHLIIWNSTFLNGHSPISATLTNASFVGNLFYQYTDELLTTPIGNSVVTYAQNGNSGGNEFLYNHFMGVYGVTVACTPNTRFVYNSWPCPHRRSAIPDSHVIGSATTGEGVLDMTDPASSTFGMPVEGSVLIDRIPFATVPVDVNGNPRTGNPDVGAVERTTTQSAPPPLTIPIGFKNL